MPKNGKVKVNVKERVDENFCDLSLSELSEIPVREIASFKRVTSLDLSSNRLITLGKNFTTLIRLVKIDLSKNQIKYLPEDFGLLRNLRHLDLYNNKLEHLPLSFGNLTNLRYLDLKGNPLTPALAKIVGFCLTTKECHDSARDTVKFLARMQNEAEKVKINFLKIESDQQIANADDLIKSNDEKSIESLKSKKTNKKTKSKTKKSNSSNNNNNKSEVTKDTNLNSPTKPNSKLTTKGKKVASGNNNSMKKSSTSSTALTSILTFFLLLAINILIIYMIMFKNPEIAEKLIEFIPQKYRDWILTKSEIFRLGVSDWISEFRTSPEEY